MITRDLPGYCLSLFHIEKVLSDNFDIGNPDFFFDSAKTHIGYWEVFSMNYTRCVLNCNTWFVFIDYNPNSKTVFTFSMVKRESVTERIKEEPMYKIYYNFKTANYHIRIANSPTNVRDFEIQQNDLNNMRYIYENVFT
jgi:hypothetical protein